MDFKTDIEIAREYANLSPNPTQAKQIFERLEAELDLTLEAVRYITGANNLLDEYPEIQKSIHHRQPYLNVLNHLQIHLMGMHSGAESEKQKQQIEKTLYRSINAIAAALRNTG